MKIYDSVTIVSDENSEVAMAIRSVMEQFRLRVQLYVGVWKQHLLDFFEGKVPCAEHIVICTSGDGDTESENIDLDEMKMAFSCVQVVDDWEGTTFYLTPRNIPKLVSFQEKRVLFCGCGSGRQAFAKAFIGAGCKSYIGATGEVDGDSAMMFVLSFFYHLLSSNRDEGITCSERKAFERAVALDTLSPSGTCRFKYFTREDFPELAK